MRILFVCLGNICRSPTRGGRDGRARRGSGVDGDEIELDSAGTGAWHVGEPADARARKAALARGIELARQRAPGAG